MPSQPSDNSDFPAYPDQPLQPVQAGFGRRFVALTIDWVFAQGIAGLITRQHTGPASFLPLAIFFVEVSILTSLTGSSAGQRVMGLRVVGIDGSLRIPVLRVVKRTILLCMVFPALLTKDSRGYHDWLSSTIVTRVLRPGQI